MRILHLITRLDRGGSATNTLLTVAGFPSLFGQSLIYGRTREFPQLALNLRQQVEMMELPDLVRSPSPLKDLVAFWKIYRLLRRGRFDLIHTHTSKAGIIGRFAARMAGVPHIVHTPHGQAFNGYAGRMLTTLFVLLERWAATFTDRIIGLTDQEIRDNLERRIGRPEQFVSIPSGIDLKRFESREREAVDVKASLGLSPSSRLIGSVGRLDPVKGHTYLLDAFAVLAPRFPDLHLALVGDGELLPELRCRAQQSGLTDRVLFLEWREDVPDLLLAFDLFVFPSLSEGMGRGLVEAMAAGLPIVATRVCSIPEVLAEGEAGCLVEPGSALALARGIETLLLDPELRSRLAKAARERAKGYSVETMLQKIEAVYQGLLESGNGIR
ncbi:MAG: glycosyltransferase family 4 protein [candidate division NC10 bacterium]|nr:glycosyltransferase family 4 protein [candidate division NC10 bacterium]